MAERVVLHVGLLKTGTSYLQKRLMDGRKTLAANDVLFPVWRHQVDAVIDVLGIRRQPRPTAIDGAWERMVDRLCGWQGTSLMSMEFLGPARDPYVEKVVRSFGSTPVEVVITARDLNRVILAMWQERAKNSATEPWPTYLKAIEEDSGVGSRFWRQQRLAVLVERWAARVGIENVTVVTVPPRGAPTETLWNRFCEAVRIDPTLCAAVTPANESLGAASAEVLRRVNEDLAGWEIPWESYSKVVKSGFAKHVLGAAREEERALGMAVPDWVVSRAASMRRNVEATGVRIVGTLDDLSPVAVEGVTPDQVAVEEQLDAAVRALGRLLRRELERDLGNPLEPREPDIGPVE
ncbi:MAG: hypothetical protein J2P22_01735 [Nocardioides sp.]|nr:hypothetical protein [Nocardioides sp.]